MALATLNDDECNEYKYIDRLNHTFDQFAKKYLKSSEVEFFIENETRSLMWHRASSEVKKEQRHLLSGVTKMYTAAVIFKLVDLHKISLETKISRFFHDSFMEQLHVKEAVDYGRTITIGELLNQTTGIPDYFYQSDKWCSSIVERFPQDPSFTLEELIHLSKAKAPCFIPGKKAMDSDTNYQLLGAIIEKVTGMELEEVFETIIYEPLGLKKTSLYTLDKEYDFGDIYYQGELYQIPNILASQKAAGGMTATLEENIVFLREFCNANLFDPSHTETIMKFQKMSLATSYGAGIMQVKMAGEEIYGHFGITGSVSVYVPKHQIYISGVIHEVSYWKPILFCLAFVRCFND